jgi:hypothetical protein
MYLAQIQPWLAHRPFFACSRMPPNIGADLYFQIGPVLSQDRQYW